MTTIALQTMHPFPILLPVRDRTDYLRQTLESLRLSYLPPEAQLVVIDDGSRDEGVAPLLASIDFVPLTRIRHDEGIGLIAIPLAIDRLFAHAHCPFVVVINSDMLFKAEWLKALLELRQAALGAGLNPGFCSVYKFRIGPEERAHGIEILRDHGEFSEITYLIGQAVCVERKAWAACSLSVFRKGFYKSESEGPTRFHFWDVYFSEACRAHGFSLVCSNRSFTQHIGAMGEHTEADGTNNAAEDF